MENDDYGHFGKGIDGYVRYMQGENIEENSSAKRDRTGKNRKYLLVAAVLFAVGAVLMAARFIIF